MWDGIVIGFSHALLLHNILYCFIGVLLGTLVGVLPGLGPAATIAMLLPITFNIPAVSSMIMLAGIYYGAQYGGSTTAILINVPGEPSSVVTALDGYQLARQGRGGIALAVAAIGSFIAGTIATFLLAFFAPALADLGLLFGPTEYFSLILLALIGSVVLARGAILPALGMILFGLLLSTVGQEVTTGMLRFTFGIKELIDGFGMVIVATAIFGVAEVAINLQDPKARDVVAQKVGNLMPRPKELLSLMPTILRGSFIGSVLGILPGGGALLASFAAYAIEKKVSKTPEKFGTGILEGVAAPESANNAGAQTSFVPMLTLGLPSNPNMAMIMGALILQGIKPGPTLVSEHPEIFWGVIASMWVGNLMLVILNLPLVGAWVKVLSAPYKLIYPCILVFCAIGGVSVANSVFDVWILAAFAFCSFILVNLDCEPAPFILAFILGPLMEENFRRAMLLSDGNFSSFVTKPISGFLLLASAAVLFVVILPSVRKVREEAFTE